MFHYRFDNSGGMQSQLWHIMNGLADIHTITDLMWRFSSAQYLHSKHAESKGRRVETAKNYAKQLNFHSYIPS
jgi:hypothetical protein